MSLTSKLFTYLLFVPSCYRFNKSFYWSDLQCGANFCCTECDSIIYMLSLSLGASVRDHMDCSPPSTEFSRQAHWSGLPFPPPGDLPDTGIEPRSPVSPVFIGRQILYHQATWESVIWGMALHIWELDMTDWAHTNTHTYIRFLYILFHYGLSWDIEYGPCAIQEDIIVYSVHKNFHLLTPTSQV